MLYEDTEGIFPPVHITTDEPLQFFELPKEDILLAQPTSPVPVPMPMLMPLQTLSSNTGFHSMPATPAFSRGQALSPQRFHSVPSTPFRKDSESPRTDSPLVFCAKISAKKEFVEMSYENKIARMDTPLDFGESVQFGNNFKIILINVMFFFLISF